MDGRYVGRGDVRSGDEDRRVRVPAEVAAQVVERI